VFQSPVAATGKNRSCNQTATGFFVTAGSGFGSPDQFGPGFSVLGDKKKLEKTDCNWLQSVFSF
jgi:hypothetical protein